MKYWLSPSLTKLVIEAVSSLGLTLRFITTPKNSSEKYKLTSVVISLRVYSKPGKIAQLSFSKTGPGELRLLPNSMRAYF